MASPHKTVGQRFRSWFTARKPRTIRHRTKLLVEHLEDRITPAGALNDHTVLILDTTVTGGASSQEANQAIFRGMTVEVVNAATWGAKTAAEFSTYRALILGDPTCGIGTSYIAAATANAAVWGPVVNGNVIINGADPVYHSYLPGAATLTKNSVDFAIDKVGKTGMYISLRDCPEISVTTSQLVYTPVHATRKQGGCDTPTVRRSGFDVG